MATVVWFRNDLRVNDHAPLLAAARQDAPLIPVVCVDVALADRRQFGIPRLGPHRARFWMECVTDLKRSLVRLGSDLVILRGRPEAVLPAFMAEHGVDQVHYHHGFAVDEVNEEAALRRAAPGIDWRGHWGGVLVTPKIAPFPVEAVPETFTGFRKKVEARTRIPEAKPAPQALPALPDNLPSSEVPQLDDLGLSPPPHDTRATLRYRGGHTAGTERVRHYIWTQDRLRVYKETRNGLLAADDSSKFSPWLAHGALSPRWIHDQIRAYERERVSNDSTYWLIFELLWRDYFQYIALKHRGRLFQRDGLRGLRLPWRQDACRLEAWKTGHTGVPLVDASMRELALTGYTSNRARQNVASFFTKILGQDWRIGAAWFEYQLVDYDPASNWGNWAYNAGVGNDARGFRYFHVPKQTRDYDPDGEFIRHWLPELADLPTKHLAEPHLAPADLQARVGIGTTYPLPIVDLRAAADQQRRAYDRVMARAP